ncbi:hypothetical protein C8Q77DRAFT_857589 [Trametes polyzona]|nr:hypothetical protein C8Q77DRAFT_857589 [Trametes polyzona]
MNTLPAELVLAILEEAQYDDLLIRYEWVKAYCRVCRAWRPFAQRLLFTQVILPSGARQCATFVAAVSSTPTSDAAHLTFLRESVRSIAMVMDDDQICAEVIELCPNVQELHATPHPESFSSEVLARLVRGPRVETLRVVVGDPWALAQLLSVYTNVKYLEVDLDLSRCSWVKITESWPTPPTQLRELRVSNLHHQTHWFLEWALSGSSRGTLEVLQAWNLNFGLHTLAGLSVGASLRSLTMSTLQLRDGDDLAAIAPNLQELELLVASPLPPSVIERLPPGIVHLALRDAIGRASLVTVVDTLAAYCVRSGGSLRVLSHHSPRQDIHVGDGPQHDGAALSHFCEAKGVEYRRYVPQYGRFAGERVPLGPARTFPRPAPTSGRRNSVGIADEKLLRRLRPQQFILGVAMAAREGFSGSRRSLTHDGY